MKTVASLLLALAACGGPPLLANAPRPNTAAVAGVAAAAAAAITLASPGSVNQKPEQKVDENTRTVEVKENVPPGVFDRLDQQQAGSGTAAPTTAPATATAHKGPAVHLPSPKEAVDRNDPSPVDQP